MAQSWFKHDYGARNDDDILELRAEYGWKGYGLFYAFIETMAENEKGAIDMEKIGGLSIGYNLPKGELISFVETCLDIGLFYKDGGGLIRNDRITNHVEKLRSFREAGKKGAKKRWSDNSNRGANGEATDTPMQSRVDKSRVDKNKPYTDDFEKFWELYDLKKGKKKAWLEWKNLTKQEKQDIFENVPVFLTHFSSKQYTPRPRKYLYNRYWEDEDYQSPQQESKQNRNGKENRAERFWRIGEELFEGDGQPDP